MEKLKGNFLLNCVCVCVIFHKYKGCSPRDPTFGGAHTVVTTSRPIRRRPHLFDKLRKYKALRPAGGKNKKFIQLREKVQKESQCLVHPLNRSTAACRHLKGVELLGIRDCTRSSLPNGLDFSIFARTVGHCREPTDHLFQA